MPAATYTQNRSERRDKGRRMRLHTQIDRQPIRHLCSRMGVTPMAVKAALHALTDSSSPSADPVWGHQKTYADKLECSVRTFQRCIKILEKIGVISVCRAEPERMPDGKWARRSTNRYYFHPPRPPGRGRKSSSDRGDTDVTYKQQPTVVEKTISNNPQIGQRFLTEDQIHNCERCIGGWIELDDLTVRRCPEA